MIDLFVQQTTSAQTHPKLYHYTSPQTLPLILQNKSFKLNCLSQVNDPEENKRITSLWNSKVFVACFTHELTNANWFLSKYGTVRITIQPNYFQTIQVYADSELTKQIPRYDSQESFSFKESSIHHLPANCWRIYDSIFADVFYSNDISQHIANDGYELNAGIIKPRCGKDNLGNLCHWYIEAETRIRVAIRTPFFESYYDKESNDFLHYLPQFTALYTPIPGDILKIELPYDTNDDYLENVRRIIKQSNLNIEIMRYTK